MDPALQNRFWTNIQNRFWLSTGLGGTPLLQNRFWDIPKLVLAKCPFGRGPLVPEPVMDKPEPVPGAKKSQFRFGEPEPVLGTPEPVLEQFRFCE